MKGLFTPTITVLISFNGLQFTKRPVSKKQHRRTRLATYKNKPIAIGGFDPDGDSHNEVEQLNFDGGWSYIEEYPFSMRYQTYFGRLVTSSVFTRLQQFLMAQLSSFSVAIEMARLK